MIKTELSPQLERVLDLASQGKKRTVIAEEMRLSMGTVNDYMDRIHKRFGVSTAAAAFRKYVEFKNRQLNLF